MKLALLDIDGVLANDTHRVDHALNLRWNSYFDPRAVGADDVWPQGKSLAHALEMDGWTIAYLTGRRSDLRQVTEDWLDLFAFPMGRLIMRPNSWSSTEKKLPLADFKLKEIRALFFAREDIDQLTLWDDDPEVVRVITDELGSDYVRHCTWHIKQKAIVTKATV